MGCSRLFVHAFLKRYLLGFFLWWVHIALLASTVCAVSGSAGNASSVLAAAPPTTQLVYIFKLPVSVHYCFVYWDSVLLPKSSAGCKIEYTDCTHFLAPCNLLPIDSCSDGGCHSGYQLHIAHHEECQSASSSSFPSDCSLPLLLLLSGAHSAERRASSSATASASASESSSSGSAAGMSFNASCAAGSLCTTTRLLSFHHPPDDTQCPQVPPSEPDMAEGEMQ